MKRFCLAAAFLLAMGAAPAFAEKTEGADASARAVPVRYADLDLSRAADAAALLSRLRLATRRACEVAEIRRPGPTLQRAIATCREGAMAEAVAQIDAPELTRLHGAERR